MRCAWTSAVAFGEYPANTPRAHHRRSRQGEHSANRDGPPVTSWPEDPIWLVRSDLRIVRFEPVSPIELAAPIVKPFAGFRKCDAADSGWALEASAFNSMYIIRDHMRLPLRLIIPTRNHLQDVVKSTERSDPESSGSGERSRYRLRSRGAKRSHQ
jgi:hypothetical protein